MDQASSPNKNAKKKADSREYALEYGSYYDFGESNTKPHTRNYRTESFSFSSTTGIEDVFAPQSENYDGRAGRIRASSLSIPHHSISTAFGPSVFASDWVPKSNSELIPPMLEALNLKPVNDPAPLEEQEELSDAIRMFSFLDLDDPMNSPPSRKPSGGTPTKIRSVTEPFTGPNTIISDQLFKDLEEEATPNATPENPWWDEMAQLHSMPANTTGSSQSIAPNSPINESLVDRSGSESPTHEFMAPSRSLWIGNIDSSFGSEELQQIFSKFGTIESIRMLPEKECAFVNYFKLDDALAAREQMQGGRIGNCIVRIGFGKTEAIHDIQGMQPTKSLWVGNILPSTKPADLEAIFAKHGKVESARVLTHKNCGFVNFYSLEEAMNAKNELNGQDIGGSVVKIGYAKVPSKVEPPMTAAQALANPAVLTTLTTQAIERVFFQSNQSPWGNTNNSANTNPLSGAPTPRTESSGNISVDDTADTTFAGGKSNLKQDGYSPSIMSLSDSNPYRKVDQNRLRDIRKKLESHIATRELEMIYYEVIDEAIELCSDYIGNVVIQKLMEKCSDPQRLRLIENISPRMASLGIHKNGTWAIQKIIDCAKTTAQIDAIVAALRAYTPALLLDQFGNYVIQCCLRLGTQKNQFIFDAMQAKCWELGQGRFGARAMKACLESQYTSKRQQKQVSLAIVQNCIQLSMNSNGSILLTWLLDMSQLPGRYRVVAPLMQQNIILLCSHKLSLSTIFKLVNQRVEMDARDIIIKAIFYNENNLHQILMDQNNGVSLIQKILASGCVSSDERAVLGSITKKVLGSIRQAQDNHVGYKRLLDEINTLPSNPPPAEALNDDDEIVSPLTNHPGFFPKSVSPKRLQTLTDEAVKFPAKNFDAAQFAASPNALPTPNHSPTQYYNQSYYAPTYGYTQPYYPPNSNFNSGATTFNTFQQSAAGSAESHYPI
ncbi:hypothetical protein HDV01_001133 [Terramyces sp. JEL0728]|nr:hypothetical protein HDV01_001133 [Terramyces sp. JEL0728]